MTVSHRFILSALAALMLAGNSQAAVLLAGFYEASADGVITNEAANFTATGISATFTGQGRASDWGSSDQTYGTFSGAGAHTGTSISYRSSSSHGGATFVITNNTGSDVSIEQISFDLHNNDESTRDYWDIVTLSYLSGDLSIADSTQINQQIGIARDNTTNGISAKGGNFVDYDWSLTGLADYTLANGESATFFIESTATDTALANVRNFAVLDNVGFVGSVITPVPEPSAAILGCFGALLLLRRRRVCHRRDDGMRALMPNL